MEKWYTSPDDVAPLFNLRELQPFLLRPLNDLEVLVVNEWVKYYKQRHRRGHEPLQSWEYQNRFPKYMANNHFEGTLLDTRFNQPGALFQNLFVSMPKIQLMSALRRLTGFIIKPTNTERKSAFREVVQMHRDTHDGELPNWEEFRQYHDQRVFLPRTGILVPSVETFEVANRPSGKSSLRWAYENAFRGSDELNSEQLDAGITGREFSEQELIDNYRKVYGYLCEKCPEDKRRQIPTALDVDEHAKSEGGIPWFVYRRWITLANLSKDSDDHRSVKWLRKQCGIPLVRTRNYNAPAKSWDDISIRQSMIALWKCNNPEGYNPAERDLIDPPSTQDFDYAAKIQAEIIEEYDSLDSKSCEERGVPNIPIPFSSTIQKQYARIGEKSNPRPGAYQKLLKDIEDQEYAHIAFARVRQLGALKRFARDNNLNVGDVPYVVGQYLETLRQL